jgi:hypothetical protein
MQEELGKPSALPADGAFGRDFRSSLLTNLLSNPFQFPSLTCAEAHLVYWTTLVLLYPLIDQLLEDLDLSEHHNTRASCYSPSDGKADSGATPNSETMPDFTTLAEHYADEVCISVVY